MSLIKINILRHLVCDVTSSPSHGPLGDGEKTPGGRVKDRTRARYCHFRCRGGAIMTSFPIGKNASNLHEFTAMTSLPVCDVTSGLLGLDLLTVYPLTGSDVTGSDVT